MSVAGRERRGTGKMELETALGPLGLMKLENCTGLRPSCSSLFCALRLFLALAASRSLICSLSEGCCISILPLP
jgi:hypothetical protein